jgi:hypothetical protein
MREWFTGLMLAFDVPDYRYRDWMNSTCMYTSA